MDRDGTGYEFVSILYQTQLKILNFQDSFDLNVAKFVYSTLAGQSPAIFSDWFTFTNNVHSHATTSSVTIIYS